MTKDLIVLGRAETASFPEMAIYDVPARVDTGARTSSIWASDIQEENGVLKFKLFGQQHPLYSGKIITSRQYEIRAVASSNGAKQDRYVVKFKVELKGRKIRASFTLANRSEQVYPMLIGRNILRGKFVVNVKHGTPLLESEKLRSNYLQSSLKEKK